MKRKFNKVYRCGRNRILTTHSGLLWFAWFYSTSKSSHHKEGRNPDIYNCLFRV